MKLIIAGCRSITDYNLVERIVNLVVNTLGLEITEVVSGKARGVDTLGEIWANSKGIPVKPFPVSSEEWKKYGNAAGILRNHEMGDYADILIAIWDDKSTGTKDMIDYMKKLRKPFYYYSPLHSDPIPTLFNFF